MTGMTNYGNKICDLTSFANFQTIAGINKIMMTNEYSISQDKLIFLFNISRITNPSKFQALSFWRLKSIDHFGRKPPIKCTLELYDACFYH
jgi:hypothetical protein